jgi:hypothetical protein
MLFDWRSFRADGNDVVLRAIVIRLAGASQAGLFAVLGLAGFSY